MGTCGGCCTGTMALKKQQEHLDQAWARGGAPQAPSVGTLSTEARMVRGQEPGCSQVAKAETRAFENRCQDLSNHLRESGT